MCYKVYCNIIYQDIDSILSLPCPIKILKIKLKKMYFKNQ